MPRDAKMANISSDFLSLQGFDDHNNRCQIGANIDTFIPT